MDLTKLSGKVLQREIEKEKRRVSSDAEEKRSKKAKEREARGKCTQSFWTTYEKRDKLRALLPEARTDSERFRMAVDIFIAAAEKAEELEHPSAVSLDWAEVD